MAPKVEVYTWRSCPFCIRVKRIAEKQNVEFIELTALMRRDRTITNAKACEWATSLCLRFYQRSTEGGCDDLYDLDARVSSINCSNLLLDLAHWHQWATQLLLKPRCLILARRHLRMPRIGKLGEAFPVDNALIFFEPLGVIQSMGR